MGAASDKQDSLVLATGRVCNRTKACPLRWTLAHATFKKTLSSHLLIAVPQKDTTGTHPRLSSSLLQQHDGRQEIHPNCINEIRRTGQCRTSVADCTSKDRRQLCPIPRCWSPHEQKNESHHRTPGRVKENNKTEVP